MKKIIMIAVAVLMATVSANAQFKKGTWSIQPMVGNGMASVTNAGDLQIGAASKLDSEATGASLIGAEAEYQFADKFSAAAGLNYTSQGVGWEDFNNGSTKMKDMRLELGYIKIPLVANFYFAKGLAFKAGIQFGFMISSKLKFSTESQGMDILGQKMDVDADFTVDFKDPFETFDFSIPFGVSYQFNFPIVIDARYQLGLTKLNKASASGINDNKNSVFMVTVGYKFKL